MKKHVRLFVLAILLAAVLLAGGCQKAQVGVNLVKNGDFSKKNGTLPADWYTESYGAVPDGAFLWAEEGHNSEGAAGISISEANDIRFIQEVAVHGNTLYKFSAYIKTENVKAYNEEDPEDAGVTKRVGGNLSVMGVFSNGEHLTGTNGWTYIEYYGKTASGQKTASLALRLGFYSADNYGTVYFDDVSFTAVETAPDGVIVHDLTDQMANSKQEDPNKTVVQADLDLQQAQIVFVGAAALVLGWVLITHVLKRKKPTWLGEKNFILLFLLAAFIVRLALAADYRGFEVDVNCFTAWGGRMLNMGPLRFYSTDYFCDYPPLYMFVAGIFSAIQQGLGLPFNSVGAALVMKLPSMLADIFLSWFIYRVAVKKLPAALAGALALLYALHPAVLVNSASWGQIDGLFTLLIVLCFYYLSKRSMWKGTMYYAIALLTKPQALVFGPVWLFAILLLIWQEYRVISGNKAGLPEDEQALEKVRKARRNFAGLWVCIGGCIVLVALLSVLMRNNQNSIFWLFEKYISTIGSYGYGSLSAFNLFALLGGQWVPNNKPVFGIPGGLTFNTLSMALILVVVVWGAYLYFQKNKSNHMGRVFLIGSFFAAATFTLLGTVHERYLLPVLALLLMTYVYYGDKRLLACFGFFGALSYINVASVLFLHYKASDPNYGYFASDDPFLLVFSGLTVAAFIYFCHVMHTLIKKEGRTHMEFKNPTATDFSAAAGPGPLLAEGVICERRALSAEGAAGETPSETEASGEAVSGETLPEAGTSGETDSGQADISKAPVSETPAPALKPACPSKTALMFAKFSCYKAEKKRLMGWKDWAIMLAVTIIYVVVALYNLGDTVAPQTYWEPQARGEFVVVDFGEVKDIQRIFSYHNIAEGYFSLSISEDGESWANIKFKQDDTTNTNFRLNHGDMFKWQTLPYSLSGTGLSTLKARYVRITAETAFIRLQEMAFFEKAGDELPIALAALRGQSKSEAHPHTALFDEQQYVPARQSYMNSMYFDEIYHARTGYEQANNWKIYETTHPPLGKDFMTISIQAFGMTPFAWRLPGAIAGIFMLPALYVFGKMLFKRRWAASALMLLMALDGMHFTQTRLATIDSFAVLFIILMYLFMYKYTQMNYYHDKLWKTFVPLGLSGIAFGLGAASKWIGIYAGVGLAVIFFITIYKRMGEYWHACAVLKDDALPQKQREHFTFIKEKGYRYGIYTLLFCLAFFVVVPLVIYCLSYIPYFTAPGNKGHWLKTILDNQKDMLSYHSGLTGDKHWFRTPWYEWPIMIKPMWYYNGDNLPSGTVETISAMGNPLVWYTGLGATVAALVMLFRRVYNTGVRSVSAVLRAAKENWLLTFCAIGLAANYLPWVLVPRSTFIYHYFAALPFIMIFTVYIMSKLVARYKKKAVIGIVVFFVLVFAMAVMFYPVWSGAQVSRQFVQDYLKWLPLWVFCY